MNHEVQFTVARNVQLIPYEDLPLEPNEIRAVAILSGISHGTEMNLYRGTSPFDSKTFDRDLRLFIDAPTTSAYPLRPGYDWVGRVTEIGAEIKQFKVGDLVHLPNPHRSTQTFNEQTDVGYGFGRAVPLPAGLEPDSAIVLALVGVALQAIHDAHIKVGDRVAIFGLGAIGLLAVQLARLNGAAWVVGIDPLPARRELAEKYGADATIDPLTEDAGLVIKTGSAPHGIDIAIEISGHYGALHQAIRSVVMGGTVVAAGFYFGDANALRLGEEWHHNRVTMISSMGVWGNAHRDHPAWNRARVHAMAAELLAQGKVTTADLVTHRLPFERAAEAYRLIEEHPNEVIKVVLEY